MAGLYTNDLLKTTWKEAVVDWFELVCINVRAVTEEGTSVMLTDLPAQMWTGDFPNTKPEGYPLHHEVRNQEALMKSFGPAVRV